jgi:hypothetical protein
MPPNRAPATSLDSSRPSSDTLVRVRPVGSRGFTLRWVEDQNSVAKRGESGEVSVELLAASLRASSSDLRTFVEVLADKLEDALPGRVRVERKPTRFLGKQKRVERLQCELGGQRYLLASRDGAVEARRATAVRGVVLKTEELPLEEWLDALAGDLATEAQTSEQAQLALQRMLAG